MEYEEVVEKLMSNNIPEITLAIGGILAIFIAILYVRDKDSAKYKLIMLLGAIYGAFMAFIAFHTYGTFVITTSIIMIVASFTLIIRPFKELHFALLIALMAMVIVYVLLGNLEGSKLEVLSDGWYRIGLAFFCGALVYMMLHMVEAVVKMIGKILNAWPLLMILGLICIVEAALVLNGYGSVYDLIRSYMDDNS
jgi:hypothetical protein